MAASGVVAIGPATNWPVDGQIASVLRNHVKPRGEKYSAFQNRQIVPQPAQPAPPRGDETRSSRNVGAGCDGRCSVRRVHSRRTKRSQRTAKSCGPGAATLASIPAGLCQRGNGDNKGRSPGRVRISRKPLRGESRDVLAVPVVQPVCFFLPDIRTRDCGRSRRPAFPAPSSKKLQRRGATKRHNPGKNAPRE